MKFFIFALSIVLFVTVAVQVHAATSTPTPDQAETNKLNQQIDQLKDKIASRVSQLNLVEKRGLIGAVEEAKGSQITLTDLEGNIRYVDVDEITKFSSPTSKATFGISDLTKGTKISVLGLYNKQSKRILARFVDVYTVATRASGAIADIDKKNYQLTLSTAQGKQVLVDIGATTGITSYTADSGEVRSGFSKLLTSQRAFVVGYPDKKDPTLLVADRIIVFPQTPKDPNIVVSQTTTEPTLAPTSAGAKSIQPVK